MTSATASLIDRAGLERARVDAELARGLDGADDGELFLEYRQSEVLVFDNGRLKQATYDTAQGFGLRAVKDEAVGYAHASDISQAALARAADAVRAVKGGYSGSYADAPPRSNVKLYGDENPLAALGFDAKVKLLEELNAYARAKDSRVRQVSASLAGTWQVVEIVRPDGQTYRDVRPLVRVHVAVVAGDGSRQESGSHGYGGREGFQRFIETTDWRDAVDQAVRQALINLDAVPAPAGEMDVVLGPGWPGVMLHEAVGHGLEGDFNRKKTSAFAGLMGQQVAAKGVTVVGDGCMAVAGLDGNGKAGAIAIGRLALAMMQSNATRPLLGSRRLGLRIGLHCGEATAGVIGGTRFSYDVWGDAVNVAARMETHGEADLIQTSAAFHELTADTFAFAPRGVVEIKGIGEMPTYYLMRERSPQLSSRPRSRSDREPGPTHPRPS